MSSGARQKGVATSLVELPVTPARRRSALQKIYEQRRATKRQRKRALKATVTAAEEGRLDVFEAGPGPELSDAKATVASQDQEITRLKTEIESLRTALEAERQRANEAEIARVASREQQEYAIQQRSVQATASLEAIMQAEAGLSTAIVEKRSLRRQLDAYENNADLLRSARRSGLPLFSECFRCSRCK